MKVNEPCSWPGVDWGTLRWVVKVRNQSPDMVAEEISVHTDTANW